MAVRPAGTARLSILTLVVFAAHAAPAHAYVRSRVDGGLPKYWQKSCVPLTIYLNTFADMTRDEVAKSVAAAAHTWSPGAVTCPDGVSRPFLEIVTSIAPENESPPAVAYDGRNTLFFYTPARPYPPFEKSGIAPGVVALTSTWARADGHIVDADITINALDNPFANLDPGAVVGNGQSPFDLQNAITHEFGHLIGLGHTCWNPASDLEQPIDDQGMPVPYCPAAPEELRQTVMFALIASDGEITKRTLSPDDIRAVCEIYPEEQDPHDCSLDVPDDGCGCSAGRGSGPAGAPAGLLLLAGFALAVRRSTSRKCLENSRTSRESG